MIITEQITQVVHHARLMQRAALCPFSKFAVGASLLTDNNQLIGGCNIESASYGLTMCAERVAIFNALASQQFDCQYLALVTDTASYPCGACRQIIYEFYPTIKIIIATPDTIVSITSAPELLPHAFGRQDLNHIKK